MRTALGIFVVAAVATAVPVDYVAPVASGYIYRSDNNGPASLIQLGAVPYQQPYAFAPPLPAPQPLKLEAIEAYDLAPAPLPYVAEPIVPVIVEDAEKDDEVDDDDEESDEYLEGDDEELENEHGHASEKAGGVEYGEHHHKAHGEHGSKGYSSKDHHADGESGHYGEEHKEGYYKEGEGAEEKHHDEADAHGKHEEEEESHEGGDHGHKKYSSKGEDITGYHKVFHKDELKKDHDFYDVADNGGHFKKFSHETGRHGSEEGAHKKGGHHDAAFDKAEFGDAGFHAKGHVNESDEAESSEEGNDSHYRHSENYGDKGGSGHHKAYQYDDDEDED